MKTVGLVWTPSASSGVDAQVVKIFDAETLEVYGEGELAPQATQFSTIVPEGTMVQGSVITVRGDQTITSVSDQLEVGYGPLAGATGLMLSIVQATQLPS